MALSFCLQVIAVQSWEKPLYNWMKIFDKLNFSRFFTKSYYSPLPDSILRLKLGILLVACHQIAKPWWIRFHWTSMYFFAVVSKVKGYLMNLTLIMIISFSSICIGLYSNSSIFNPTIVFVLLINDLFHSAKSGKLETVL